MKKILFLGPEGTFSHEAALYFWARLRERTLGEIAEGYTLIPCASFPELFTIYNTEAEGDILAVIPVENNSEGRVNEVHKLLPDLSVKGCFMAEYWLPVRHSLLSHVAALNEVTKVYGHPQALAQCQGWIAQNLPFATPVIASSNAEGARLASREMAAAVGSASLSERYGIPIIATDIQDNPSNATRFILMGGGVAPEIFPWKRGEYKFSLMVETANKPGALYKVLKEFLPFQLTRVETFPVGDGARYRFFLDGFDGTRGDDEQPSLMDVLGWLQDEQKVLSYNFFGSYIADTAFLAKMDETS